MVEVELEGALGAQSLREQRSKTSQQIFKRLAAQKEEPKKKKEKQNRKVKLLFDFAVLIYENCVYRAEQERHGTADAVDLALQ